MDGHDINSLGQIVGFSWATDNGNIRAWLWDPGTQKMAALGTPGPEFGHCFASAISDQGLVVGRCNDTQSRIQRAVLWDLSTGKITILEGLGHHASASDVSDHGQIIGASSRSPELYENLPVLWETANPAGSISDLSTAIDDLQTAGTINAGVDGALRVKLEAAVESLGKGRWNAAVRQLIAFIRSVEAFVRSGRLPTTDGEALVLAASSIIDQIRDANG